MSGSRRVPRVLSPPGANPGLRCPSFPLPNCRSVYFAQIHLLFLHLSNELICSSFLCKRSCSCPSRGAVNLGSVELTGEYISFSPMNHLPSLLQKNGKIMVYCVFINYCFSLPPCTPLICNFLGGRGVWEPGVAR